MSGQPLRGSSDLVGIYYPRYDLASMRVSRGMVLAFGIPSFIILANHTPGGGALSPGELAKRTILWVSIGIIAMVFITYLLSSYNMRWIARRAAARRK